MGQTHRENSRSGLVRFFSEHLWATRKQRVITACVLAGFVVGINVLGTYLRDRAEYRVARAELEKNVIDLHEIAIAFEDKLKDKKFTGVETITVTSAGDKMQHGLLRHLWTKFSPQAGTDTPLAFSPAEVWINNTPSKVSKVEGGGEFQVIALGDPEVKLAPGVHQFTLRYETKAADFMRGDAREGFIYNLTAPIGFLTRKLRGTVLLPGYAKLEEVFAVGRISARHPDSGEVGATGLMLQVRRELDPESKRVVVFFESQDELLPGGFGTIEIVW